MERIEEGKACKMGPGRARMEQAKHSEVMHGSLNLCTLIPITMQYASLTQAHAPPDDYIYIPSVYMCTILISDNIIVVLYSDF